MSVFSQTGGIHPKKSFFNLAHEVKFDCSFNEIIPVMRMECVPGDYISLSVNAVCRFNPMLAPILQAVNVSFFAFHVPTRILDENWEEIISGGQGNNTSLALPVWSDAELNSATKPIIQKYSLWDYFGLPLVPTGSITQSVPILKYPWYAYNMIWNEYFRDENLQSDELGLVRALDDNTVALRSWRKDYFTSALPFQERGNAPAIALSGSGSAVWSSSVGSNAGQIPNGAAPSFTQTITKMVVTDGNIRFLNYDEIPFDGSISTSHVHFIPASNLNANVVDPAQFGTFDVNDFRVMFQTQKWQERNARAGVRYTELLRSHFGIAPSDARLQRPQYIGGATFPVMVSEVLQTSSTNDTSPQGHLAGHGLVAGRDKLGSIKVTEYGYLLVLMAVSVKPQYQDGINRMFMRSSRYDFYWPEFAHLSEQGIYEGELFWQGLEADKGIFGYTGRYNELRYMPSYVCGNMRDTYDYWHMGRKFANAPELNADFIATDGMDNTFMRCFAVTDKKPMIWTVGNVVNSSRPLPYLAEPGLVDHF